jgi:hypothetical protein
MVDKIEYIRRFKEIYKIKTGKEVTDQEAFDLFEKLTTLVSVVYQSIPKK